MAGKGNTIPKPEGARRRTNKAPKTEHLEAQFSPIGPELPAGIDWPAQTRIWWDNWRLSPQASRFIATDWDFLLDTAMLHARLWLDGDTSVLPELRLRVSKLGATDEDRMRLRIDTSPKEGKPSPSKPTGGAYSHLKAV